VAPTLSSRDQVSTVPASSIYPNTIPTLNHLPTLTNLVKTRFLLLLNQDRVLHLNRPAPALLTSAIRPRLEPHCLCSSRPGDSEGSILEGNCWLTAGVHLYRRGSILCGRLLRVPSLTCLHHPDGVLYSLGHWVVSWRWYGRSIFWRVAGAQRSTLGESSRPERTLFKTGSSGNGRVLLRQRATSGGYDRRGIMHPSAYMQLRYASLAPPISHRHLLLCKNVGFSLTLPVLSVELLLDQKGAESCGLYYMDIPIRVR
jgi:hypothetical protein